MMLTSRHLLILNDDDGTLYEMKYIFSVYVYGTDVVSDFETVCLYLSFRTRNSV